MVWTIVIAVMPLAKFILNLAADILNLRSLRGTLPEEFSGLFDETAYQKSQDYTAAKTKLGLIVSTCNLIVLFGFWLAGGFGFLDSHVRSLSLSLIWTGLIYLGVLMLANYLFLLPFKIYETFALEEHFGFNRTTVKTFILDIFKSVGLSILIGGPVLALVLYLFQSAGDFAWFYAWLAVSFISVGLIFLTPSLLLPLFYKFTPMAEGELKEAIMSLARQLNFPLVGIFVIDGSRRSNKANAFFVGFGKFKRVALYDTLIAQQTIPELLAVLAHEIGHYKKKHTFRHLVFLILQFGFVFYLFFLLFEQPEFFKAFAVDQRSVYAGLVFFAIAYSFLGKIISVIGHTFSRRYEYEADEFAAKATGNPEILISSLKKLGRNNLANLQPHPVYTFLNYSHPPLLERFSALRNAP